MQAAFDKQLEAAAAAAQPPSPKKALHTDPRFIEQEVAICTEGQILPHSTVLTILFSIEPGLEV